MDGLMRVTGLDASGSQRRAGWLLVLVCLAVYLPGAFTIPPVDRDESRFAQASREMVSSGSLTGWMIPRVQDRPRLNKPPLIYWLQAGCVALTRSPDAIGVYRIPSLLAAVASVLLTWRLGLVLFTHRIGLIAAVLLALAPIVLWEARQARADMLLLACTLAALLALARLWRGDARASDAVLLWTGLTLGVLTKGPITPLVVALTALTLSLTHRRWAWLRGARIHFGLPALFLVVLAWAGQVAREVGWGEYARLVLDETLGRSLSAREGHSGPPGYHLLLLPALFWPGSMLAGLALLRPILRRRARLRPVVHPGEAFCLAWLLPSWVLFEAVSTKLPHYTLPLYPAIALVSACALVAATRQRLEGLEARFTRLAHAMWWLIGPVLVIGLPIVLSTLDTDHDAVSWAVLAAVLVLGVYLLGLAWLALRRRDWLVAQASTAAAAAVVSILGLGVLLPRADTLWISDRLWVHLRAAPPDRPLAMDGYSEDSLVFLSAGRVRRIEDPGEFLAARDPGSPGGLLVLPARDASEQWRVIARVQGFNYSKGRREDLVIVEARP